MVEPAFPWPRDLRDRHGATGPVPKWSRSRLHFGMAAWLLARPVLACICTYKYTYRRICMCICIYIYIYICVCGYTDVHVCIDRLTDR